MKLVINYDFFNEVRNAREPYTPLKIIRNNRISICYFHFPLCMALNLRKEPLIEALKEYGMAFLNLIAICYIFNSIFAKKNV